MATRQNIAALLRLLSDEATEGAKAAPDAELRWLDVLVRNAESDLERTRQELDELLRAEGREGSGGGEAQGGEAQGVLLFPAPKGVPT